MQIGERLLARYADCAACMIMLRSVFFVSKLLMLPSSKGGYSPCISAIMNTMGRLSFGSDVTIDLTFGLLVQELEIRLSQPDNQHSPEIVPSFFR